MRRLLTGYAVSYNRRHKRHGQVFENRYKSIICQEDAYLQEVADLSELARYAYCGRGALMGRERRGLPA